MGGLAVLWLPVPYKGASMKYADFSRSAKRAFLLLLLTALSILFIVILFKVSKAPNTYSNAFERTFLKRSLLIPTYYRDLRSKNFYIVGHTKDGVYISNYDSQDRIDHLNDSFTTISGSILQYGAEIPSHKSRLIVDSPFILLADQETGRIIYLNIKSPADVKLINDSIKISPFSSVARISSSSVILRMPDSSLKRNTLLKWNLLSGSISRADGILKKQKDGFFCTDGLMCYDSIDSKLLYVYYYRNEFICLDTNLVIKYRGKTIDTNQIAKIKVSRISSEDSYTFSAPPISINQQICSGNGLLFIRSGLLADHEDRLVFGKSSAVDAYRISDGKYKFSFHILDFDGYKISDFIYFNHHFAAIQGHYIVYYPSTF